MIVTVKIFRYIFQLSISVAPPFLTMIDLLNSRKKSLESLSDVSFHSDLCFDTEKGKRGRGRGNMGGIVSKTSFVQHRSENY